MKVQPFQVLVKFFPEEVSSRGKLVMEAQFCQVLAKFVTVEVLITPKEVMFGQPYQAACRFVPKLNSGAVPARTEVTWLRLPVLLKKG